VSLTAAKRKFRYSYIEGTCGSYAVFSKCHRRWRVVLRDSLPGALIVLMNWATRGCGSSNCGGEGNHGISNLDR
jgi:hypothetical protein